MTSIIRAASNAIPSKLRPVLLVFFNLALAAGLSYLANPWIGHDIMAVERPMTTLNDYLGVVGWRIVEVLGYWIGGWDGMAIPASSQGCDSLLTMLLLYPSSLTSSLSGYTHSFACTSLSAYLPA